MALAPPRRLTKQQFLHKRPKGTYQNYLNAYTRQHGGPPPGGSRPNQPFAGPTFESLLRGIQIDTPAQLQKRANQMANSGIASQQALIREEAKMMRDEAQRRMLAMAAAGRAAAAQNAGLFGMVGGEYNAAAQEISGLGSNLANQMQATTAGDELAQNAGLAAVGAPGISGLGGATQAGVEAYRGGTLPAQGIGTAGQAAQFGLAGMVSSQNLRATQEAQAAYVESIREADRARTSAIKALASGRPEQVGQFLMQLQEANANARDSALSLLTARQTFGLQNQENKRATAGARQDRATTIQNRRLARQEAAMAGRQIDETRSIALGYYVDMQGRPVLKNGKQIKVPRTGTTKDGPTDAEVRADAGKAAEYWIRNSRDRRGNLTRTKAQLQAYLTSLYPGRPKLVQQIVAATYPKGATKTGAVTTVIK